MPPATAVTIDQASEAKELRSLTLCRAKLSFVFFVRSALGYRAFSKLRLEAVVSGTEEPSAVEAKLLRQWTELREQGTLPPQLSWMGGVA